MEHIAIVEISYQNESGTLMSRRVPWKRGIRERKEMNLILEGWIIDYYDRVYDGGYLPAGFSVAPKPLTARVLANGRTLAKWHKLRLA